MTTRTVCRPAPYPSFDGTQACAQPTPPETAAAFLGQVSPATAAAVGVCGPCPFRGACRDYALSHDVHGVWGGLTAPERRELRRRCELPDPVSPSDELDVLVRTARHSPEPRATA